MSYSPGTNTGDGHVWTRPDGIRMRCGGPGICKKCSQDYADRAIAFHAAGLNSGDNPETLKAVQVFLAKDDRRKELMPSTPTLRDYYAAHAMGALIGIHPVDRLDAAMREEIAEAAFAMADAMLKRGN